MTEIDITATGEDGVTFSWGGNTIIEFEIVDGRLRIYTDGEVGVHEMPVEDIEHLAVSTEDGDGVHASGYLDRNIVSGSYTPEIPNR